MSKEARTISMVFGPEALQRGPNYPLMARKASSLNGVTRIWNGVQRQTNREVIVLVLEDNVDTAQLMLDARYAVDDVLGTSAPCDLQDGNALDHRNITTKRWRGGIPVMIKV